MKKQMEILVVDDDPNIRLATVRLFGKAGYAVAEAANGTDALRLIHEIHPDLVLLDIVLPDADGMELAEMIKSSPQTDESFVILISSKKVSTRDRVHGLTIGADGYLTRPISNRDLLAHVDAFFRIKAMEKALREDKENLRITLEAISDAVVTADHAGRIVTLNPAAEKLCGWTREQAHGMPFAEIFQLLDETTLQDREDLARQVLQEGKILQMTRPTLLVSKTGKKIPVTNSGAPIRSTTGAVVGIVLVFQDVTMQRQKEKEILQLNDELEQKVAEKTRELRERVAELERYHDATIQREFRVKDLRDEIKRLKNKDNK
ncbi:MAG: response regulator [Candidatus Aminicenantes bacterium]|nr:response regulator [Candidatus Aminicenantes bacterium]